MKNAGARERARDVYSRTTGRRLTEKRGFSPHVMCSIKKINVTLLYMKDKRRKSWERQKGMTRIFAYSCILHFLPIHFHFVLLINFFPTFAKRLKVFLSHLAYKSSIVLSPMFLPPKHFIPGKKKFWLKRW